MARRTENALHTAIKGYFKACSHNIEPRAHAATLTKLALTGKLNNTALHNRKIEHAVMTLGTTLILKAGKKLGMEILFIWAVKGILDGIEAPVIDKLVKRLEGIQADFTEPNTSTYAKLLIADLEEISTND